MSFHDNRLQQKMKKKTDAIDIILKTITRELYFAIIN